MDNQEKILQTALHLFNRKGYEGTGVQEIVREAEVTKPTLYYYFGSKRGLLDALLKKYYTVLLDELGKIRYSGDLPLTLIKITDFFFMFAKANEEFYRMQITMSLSSPDSEPHEATLPYQAAIHQILENIFTEATVQHGNMKNRQKRYAVTFGGMINTFIIIYLNRHIELTSETVQLAVHQFSHGIYS